MVRLSILFAAALLLAGCVSSAVLGGDDPSTWRCEAETPEKDDSAILFVRNSAEYRGLAREIFANATAAMQNLAHGKRRGSWFVIMDGDETLLDNSPYMAERRRCRLDFTPGTWAQWVAEESASAVPGGASFVRAVHEAGGYVAVVSNRDENARAATLAAFSRNNIAVDALLLHAEGAPADKAPRWRSAGEAIAQAKGGKPPKPVMWIGDQMSDLPRLSPAGDILGARDQSLRDGTDEDFAGFGKRFFLLPNPLYGAWD